MDFNLYLITDRNQAGEEGILSVVEGALKGGVRAVQLREKDMNTRDLFELAVDLRLLTRTYGAKLFINDRLDVALAADCDGVHLGQGGFLPGDARSLLSSNKLIGVSTHGIEEARAANEGGADFITLGPVFFTPSKAGYGEPLGVECLNTVKAEVNIPVFALGGVKKENVREVLNTGVDGVAVISALIAATDSEVETREMLKVMRE